MIKIILFLILLLRIESTFAFSYQSPNTIYRCTKSHYESRPYCPRSTPQSGNKNIVHNVGNKALQSTSSSIGTMSFIGAATLRLVSLGKLYSIVLESRPILTKSVSAGVIFALSDFLAQQLEKRGNKEANTTTAIIIPQKIEKTRIFASTIVGFFYFGPLSHYWYEWMFYILPEITLYSNIKKAILGQLLFGPAFTFVYFASSLIQTNKFSLKNWYNKIKNDFPKVFLAELGFWPLAEVISYAYIPKQFIPLFMDFCSFLWTTYLALRTYAK